MTHGQRSPHKLRVAVCCLLLDAIYEASPFLPLGLQMLKIDLYSAIYLDFRSCRPYLHPKERFREDAFLVHNLRAAWGWINEKKTLKNTVVAVGWGPNKQTYKPYWDIHRFFHRVSSDHKNMNQSLEEDMKQNGPCLFIIQSVFSLSVWHIISWMDTLHTVDSQQTMRAKLRSFSLWGRCVTSAGWTADILCGPFPIKAGPKECQPALLFYLFDMSIFVSVFLYPSL